MEGELGLRKTDKGGEKAGEQQTNGARERDDEIIPIGMCFAPEGQIVLRL